MLIPGASAQQQQQLDLYISLLAQWNRVYNLIGQAHAQDLFTQVILDSLSVQDYLVGKRIVDIGTGAGIPGIPLAIMQPDKQFTLLDSRSKRIHFLRQVQQACQIKNIEIVHSRVEAYNPDFVFDCVLSRAFASLADMLEMTQHLIGPQGRWLAMKGPKWQQELENISKHFKLLHSYSIQLPGCDKQRYLLELSRA
jgi:16S rRNA (guanine527-N7)-methyltransferase